jgi:small subunit ribosomal protein S20
MANHESAKKAYRQSEKKCLVNKSRKSKVKTLTKKVLDAISNKDADTMKSAFQLFQSEIMKAVSKKVYKKNNASRKVSNLSNLIKNSTI